MPNYPRADVLEKKPTPLQKKFASYIKSQTGFDPDLTTIVLFQAFRTPFQRSDDNQLDLAKRREAAEARREAAASAPPKKRGRPAKAKTEAVAELLPTKKASKKAASAKKTVVDGTAVNKKAAKAGKATAVAGKAKKRVINVADEEEE